MIRKLLLISFFLIIITNCYAQKNIIKISNIQTEKGYNISLKNNSNIQYEVTHTVKVVNLNSYEKPIIILIPAKTSSEVLTLYFKNLNKSYEYFTSYIYKPLPSDTELFLEYKKREMKT